MCGVLKFNFPDKIAILGFLIFKLLLKMCLLLETFISPFKADIPISKFFS